MQHKSYQRIPDSVKPVAIHFYFDKSHLWLTEPLDTRQLDALTPECRKVPYHDESKPAPFDRHYRQYLDLQPSPEALRMLLAWRDHAYINYVEPAFDLVFGNYFAAEWWTELFQNHFLQGHHRASMSVASYPDGGFSTRPHRHGKPRRGRWFHYYSDKPCRITHESHCFHFEGKHDGVAAVRRLGIHSLADLVSFDFVDYFTRSLKLYSVDLERLGRFERNRRSGSRRQQPTSGNGNWNHDKAIGSALYRRLSLHHDGSHAHSLQQFVDSYGRGPFLVPIFADPPLLIMLMRHICELLSELPVASAHLPLPTPHFAEHPENISTRPSQPRPSPPQSGRKLHDRRVLDVDVDTALPSHVIATAPIRTSVPSAPASRPRRQLSDATLFRLQREARLRASRKRLHLVEAARRGDRHASWLLGIDDG
jgi:hypothetical protein